MINSEHVLLQNPNYIAFGIWPTQTLLTQLQIHRDVQKFLLRAYGLTLDQTARSDLVSVTQDIYLNRPPISSTLIRLHGRWRTLSGSHFTTVLHCPHPLTFRMLLTT